MERAAAELFSAADTVPGVNCRCCAMVFRVTRSGLRTPGFALRLIFIGNASMSRPAITAFLIVSYTARSPYFPANQYPPGAPVSQTSTPYRGAIVRMGRIAQDEDSSRRVE